MALVSLSNGWKASAEKLTSKLSEKVESFLRKQCVLSLHARLQIHSPYKVIVLEQTSSLLQVARGPESRLSSNVSQGRTCMSDLL